MFGQYLPIYDSLTHPTFSGEWSGKSRFPSSSFNDLSHILADSNICSAVASTFPLNETVLPDIFSLECSRFADLTGIKLHPAYIVKDHSKSLDALLTSISNTSYQYNLFPIIKLNSCFIDFGNLDAIRLLLSRAVNCFGSRFMLYVCTYPYSVLRLPQIIDIRPLINFLSQGYSYIPIVLLHGGTVQLLEISQYAQHFKNMYLDLSFTICRYINSSLFYDFCYLFEYLDQKIVIGTDHPEYTYVELRDAICKIENRLRFQANITDADLKEKLSNIMFKNMTRLTSHE